MIFFIVLFYVFCHSENKKVFCLELPNLTKNICFLKILYSPFEEKMPLGVIKAKFIF